MEQHAVHLLQGNYHCIRFAQGSVTGILDVGFTSGNGDQFIVLAINMAVLSAQIQLMGIH